jgi:hypothetical protein
LRETASVISERVLILLRQSPFDHRILKLLRGIAAALCICASVHPTGRFSSPSTVFGHGRPASLAEAAV